MTDVVPPVMITLPTVARSPRVGRLTGVRAVAVPTVLLTLSASLLRPWWERGEAVPLSWALPPAELLLVAPAVPVIGLLALRATVGGPGTGRVAARLSAAAARWAKLWAVVAVGWFLVSVVGLYGTGLGGVLTADNVPAVVAASPTAVARLALVWVALLVALFGSRFDRRGDTLGLLALVTAAVLTAAPGVPVVHDHASSTHTLVQALAAVELIAVLVWAGAASGAVRLPRRQASRRAGGLVTASVLALGLAAVTAGALRPDGTTPPAIAIVQAAAVGVVVAVGHRHRERVDEMITSGRGHRWVTAVGDGVVLVAVVLLGCVLPLGG